MPLTEKQQTAVDLYIEGMGKVAACRAAGYATPEVQAVAVFNSPAVKGQIEERRMAIRKEKDLQVADVLDGLMEGVQAAQNTADIVMAWREIGKIIGAYEHAKKVEVKIEHEHIKSVKQLERMSDKQLAELAELGGELVIEDAEWEEVDDGESD